mmetsp:Transcript_42487/g.117231  ORF Transcript_42487/g.117231 Transcript_42487/m.117231 type:complete len:355 (-) Transcript_42487:626-1690(-)
MRGELGDRCRVPSRPGWRSDARHGMLSEPSTPCSPRDKSKAEGRRSSGSTSPAPPTPPICSSAITSRCCPASGANSAAAGATGAVSDSNVADAATSSSCSNVAEGDLEAALGPRGSSARISAEAGAMLSFSKVADASSKVAESSCSKVADGDPGAASKPTTGECRAGEVLKAESGAAASGTATSAASGGADGGGSTSSSKVADSDLFRSRVADGDSKAVSKLSSVSSASIACRGATSWTFGSASPASSFALESSASIDSSKSASSNSSSASAPPSASSVFESARPIGSSCPQVASCVAVAEVLNRSRNSGNDMSTSTSEKRETIDSWIVSSTALRALLLPQRMAATLADLWRAR